MTCTIGTTTTTTVVSCKYSNGKCPHPRAVKSSGELHTLCQIHREKACSSQRRIDQMKRKPRKTTVRKPRKKETAKQKVKTKSKKMMSKTTYHSPIPLDNAEDNIIVKLLSELDRQCSMDQEELDFVLSCCSSSEESSEEEEDEEEE